MEKSEESLGGPSTTFLGNPRAKRTTVLPARVFDIAAGHKRVADQPQLAGRAGCPA